MFSFAIHSAVENGMIMPNRCLVKSYWTQAGKRFVFSAPLPHTLSRKSFIVEESRPSGKTEVDALFWHHSFSSSYQISLSYSRRTSSPPSPRPQTTTPTPHKERDLPASIRTVRRPEGIWTLQTFLDLPALGYLSIQELMQVSQATAGRKSSTTTTAVALF
ncbi:hypothetical protein GE21DRAFT_1078337 [Neurospora crassa]|nr:hypothetical protein GE21DRAFT_1078337 [Neurospora crassa]